MKLTLKRDRDLSIERDPAETGLTVTVVSSRARISMCRHRAKARLMVVEGGRGVEGPAVGEVSTNRRQ